MSEAEKEGHALCDVTIEDVSETKNVPNSNCLVSQEDLKDKLKARPPKEKEEGHENPKS